MASSARTLRRLVGASLAAGALLLFARLASAEDADPPAYRRPGAADERGPEAGSLGPPIAVPADEEAAPARPAWPGFLPIPDRWRLAEDLGIHQRWWDPYNQNVLKGDRPVFGDDWFVNLSVIADMLFEARKLPTPVGSQATSSPGSLDVFGNGNQIVTTNNLIFSAALTEGDTTFRPPEWEFRLTAVGNVNYASLHEAGVLNVNPDLGTTRADTHASFQELFLDRHLRDVSDNYDFDSLRVGIQPFVTDFRGFLFLDSQPGVRLFGNRWSNRLQYNLAWFRRLEKDTNSGLNTVFYLRADDVFVANAFLQDFPVPGFTSEALVTYNRNREGDRADHYDTNGFLERPAPVGDERPHNYDVVYPGIGGDGHIGPVNLTHNMFLAVGSDNHNPIAQRSVDIFAYLLAAEASMDFDWYRVKLFAYHASGDSHPFDGTARGFDAIFEDPKFDGAATSYWVRQAMPLIGGGGVALTGRNALLPALRPSKDEGQSNFVNPGLTLVGIGADFDVTPELRVLSNVSSLWFDQTQVLETLRQQPSVAQDIGYDLSVALIYRPLFTENVIFNLSGAILVPAQGLNDLYSSQYNVFYSALANVVLTY
jgi:hypothetical protein